MGMIKMGPNTKDLTGRKFGRLSVIALDTRKWDKSGRPRLYWYCECDCGGNTVVVGSSLSQGLTQSCGCYNRAVIRARRRVHGDASKTRRVPEYYTYFNMIKRCYNKNDRSYQDYGGRGITVCDEWMAPGGYEQFLSDMGRKPSSKHSIDRMNNSLGYSKENCRWATASEQVRNRRPNASAFNLIIDGQTMSISELAAKHGVSMKTLYDRISVGCLKSDLIKPARNYSRRGASPCPS